MERIAPGPGDDYRERYGHLLTRIAERCPDVRQRLCAFWPVRGRSYEPRGLMVVGRAVNGWGGSELSFRPGEPDGPAARELANRARAYSAEKGLAWLADLEGSGGPYDPARSPFWTVARALVERTGAVRRGGTWSAVLAWTNLYKVAPWAAGNPTGCVRAEQVEACGALLEREVAAWDPGVVLCLSGWGFSAEVLAGAGVTWEEPPVSPHLHRVGAADGRTWIVTPHPQRRQREPLVDAVIGVVGRLAEEGG